MLLNTVNGLPSGSGGSSSGPVYGKAVFFGDSITQGVGNDDYSYVDVLQESGVFQDVKKYGVGGACIHPDSDTSLADYALINQINRYASDVSAADIVFIEYSANDMIRACSGYSSVALGFSSDSAADDTLCGYARRAIERVKELAPNAQIIWLHWMPWRADGHTSIQVDDAFKQVIIDSALLYEATLYRLVRNYGCMIIDLSDGIEYGEDTFFSDDKVHPNTAGHQRAARTLVANMYGNSVEKNLYREYKIVANSVENISAATIDGHFIIALWLLQAGGVDVSLTLDIGGYCTHYKPIGFHDSYIAFETLVNDGSGPFLNIVTWNPNNSIVFDSMALGSGSSLPNASGVSF